MAQSQYLGEWDEEIVTAPSGGYVNGDIVKAPSGRAGVVMGLCPIDAGQLATLKTTGKVRVAAGSSTTFSAAGEVQWDNTNKVAVGSSGTFHLGVAAAAKTSGQTTVDVILNGRPAPAPA